MSKTHLSDDQVTLVINAKSEKAQQNIHTFSKEIDRLGDRNKSLQRQMESLEIAGKKNTDSWRQRREEYGRNITQIRNLKKQIADETKSLDLNALTMSQLRRQARELQRQLDNTSRAINPEEWNRLSNQLSNVKSRINNLSDASKTLVEKYSNPQTMSFFRGELFIRFAEMAGRAVAKIKEITSESIDMAQSADGVTRAFQKLEQPGLLNNLRAATKNTVNDVELMKAAVKAKDFRIPLEDLSKYLSFAQLKAQQTGQSLDYMVDSIVTGLGRQSPLILDNLGLSAAEIGQKTKETGNFMKAVASIVENQLAQAGQTYISAADRAAQKTTALQNKQLELGQALLPLKEKATDAFGAMKIGIMETIVWLITHRKTTIALGLALTSLTIAMTILNAQFKAWVAQTVIAKTVIAGWTTLTTTLKGVYLLVAAAINTMRGQTVLATAQMRLFNMTCRANIYLLFAAALVAVGVAIYAYIKKIDKAKVAMVNFNLEHAKVAADIKKQMADIDKKVNESVASEITKIKSLQATIHDSSKSYDQRKKAILNMQSIVPGYHASITKEGRLFNENSSAIDNYIKNLRRAARAEAAYEKMKDNEKKILDAQDTVTDASNKKRNVRNAAARRGVNLNNGERIDSQTQVVGTASSGQVFTNTIDVVVNKSGKVIRQIDKATANMVELDQQWSDMFGSRVKAAQDKIKQYTEQNNRLQRIVEQNGGVKQNFSSSNSKQGTVGAELDAISEKIDALKAKRLTIKVGDTKALKAIDNQIAALEKRKENLEYNKSSGKKKTGKDPDNIATRNFSSARQAEINHENNAYQESLNKLNMSLAQKKLSQEQYNIYVSALNTQHANNLLTIEQNYQKKSKQIIFKDSAKKKQLIESQNQNVKQAQQKLTESKIAAEEKYQSIIEKIAEQGKIVQTQTLEQEREAKLSILEGYYKAALQLANQSGEEQSNVETAYQTARQNIIKDFADKELARAKELEEQKTRTLQEYGLETFQEQYEAQIKKRKEDLEKGIINKQQYDQALINLEQDTQARLLQIRQQYGLQTLDEQLAVERQRREAEYKAGRLTKQQYEQSLVNLEQDTQARLLQIRQQYGIATQQELYNVELAQLKQHLQNKEISETEYQEAVKQMKIKQWKEQFDYYSNLFGNAIQALQDAEAANVEAKYDAEIEAARNAGQDTTAIEKKKANEKLKIQKKYADVNFAIKASQIIADTSVAIMQAFSQLGPVAGAIAGALMSVTGTMQLAAANAERQKVKKLSLDGSASSAPAGARVTTGLESGGSIDVQRRQDGRHFNAEYQPSRRGFINRPTVLVGEGPAGQSREWVASNAAVQNPTVSPVLNILDQAQRAGTIRTLDLNKILLQQQLVGRASGGFISPATSPAAATPVSLNSTPASLNPTSLHPEVVEKLTEVLERLSTEGIPASVALDEFEQKQQLRNRARNFASK